MLKVVKVLSEVKSQQEFQQRQRAYAATIAQAQSQAHAQAQQQQSPSANGGVNGSHPPPNTTAGSELNLHASATTQEGANMSGNAPSSGKSSSARVHPASAGYFLPEQLSTLKVQIYAFKLLSKNLGIPQPTQQQLFALKKASMSAPATSHPDIK